MRLKAGREEDWRCQIWGMCILGVHGFTHDNICKICNRGIGCCSRDITQNCYKNKKSTQKREVEPHRVEGEGWQGGYERDPFLGLLKRMGCRRGRSFGQWVPFNCVWLKEFGNRTLNFIYNVPNWKGLVYIGIPNSGASLKKQKISKNAILDLTSRGRRVRWWAWKTIWNEAYGAEFGCLPLWWRVGEVRYLMSFGFMISPPGIEITISLPSKCLNSNEYPVNAFTRGISFSIIKFIPSLINTIVSMNQTQNTRWRRGRGTGSRWARRHIQEGIPVDWGAITTFSAPFYLLPWLFQELEGLGRRWSAGWDRQRWVPFKNRMRFLLKYKYKITSLTPRFLIWFSKKCNSLT